MPEWFKVLFVIVAILVATLMVIVVTQRLVEDGMKRDAVRAGVGEFYMDPENGIPSFRYKATKKLGGAK